MLNLLVRGCPSRRISCLQVRTSLRPLWKTPPCKVRPSAPRAHVLQRDRTGVLAHPCYPWVSRVTACSARLGRPRCTSLVMGAGECIQLHGSGLTNMCWSDAAVQNGMSRPPARRRQDLRRSDAERYALILSVLLGQSQKTSTLILKYIDLMKQGGERSRRPPSSFKLTDTSDYPSDTFI
ncbi:hypothetical protein BC628DRAFT_798589 [Trametes gibbosa]|nr:hypothetical protein BC628DRAFT_798589 [Trametes gibbosa]